MSETPLRFRHQGHSAGLRERDVVVPEVWRRAAPPPRRRIWGWFGVPVMGCCAGVLWWLGGKYPVFDDEKDAEISPVVEVAELGRPQVDEAVAKPRAVTPVVAAPTLVAPPVESPMVTNEPWRRRARTSVTQPPLPPVAQLSLVQVTGVEQALVPGIRTAVDQRLLVLRMCCESVMRGSAVKGEIIAEITTREGVVTAIDVDSSSRDASLRWCFRKHLMGARMPSAGVGFDARLEFFLTPRARRATARRRGD